MNISTSSQLCFPVLTAEFTPPRCELPTPVSYFPFFNGKFLAVAASLNGGNTLSAFVRMLQGWFATFGKYTLALLLHKSQHILDL
jgi:sedoheptulokinase